MKLSTLLEVISAAHLAPCVEIPLGLNVFGGMMLVAPPGNLKSTIIKRTLEPFPNAMVISDLNVRQIMRFRDDVASGSYSTLAFTEMSKLYARHDTTSSNVEGHLAAMVDEGFKHTSNEDQRMHIREARCLVVGGMTNHLYRLRFSDWLEGGFYRRFIWCHYVLADKNAVIRAIHDWRGLEIGTDMVLYGAPPKGSIPYSLSDKESAFLIKALRAKGIPEIETPLILLKKIACVLKWRYKDQSKTRAMEIMEDFAECLTKKGAELDLK